jgi:uncharacterized repeat protein (TIGR03803 family)
MRRDAFFGKFVLAGVVALATFAPLGRADAVVTLLCTFKGGKDGSRPKAGVIEDKVGNLYGTTFGGGREDLGTVFKLAPDGTETVLHAFTDKDGDGQWPQADLLEDEAANLYGTTSQGSPGPYYGGTVFEIAPGGTETVLYAFTEWNDGGGPTGLIQDSAGNLFGATTEGGNYDCTNGCGLVFKVAPDGTETVLYSFTGEPDGATPKAGLIRDKAGNLYGTTEYGGGDGSGCGNGSFFGCGTVFKLAPDGTETVLYAFRGGDRDGSLPEAGLIRDKTGNLYGTTANGGGTSCYQGDGCGTVFKLAPDGTETVLYAFAGGSDGATPETALIRDKAGGLYGTTTYGGTGSFENGYGVVFQLAADGTETVLYAFGRHKRDGEGPEAGLMKGEDGELYGTASYGGSKVDCNGYGCGTVLKLKK